MNTYQRIHIGGAVRRFHTRPTIVTQTVAAHSWGVAAMLFDICEPTKELLQAALYHDISEFETGDVPFTAKKECPGLKAILDDWERNIDVRIGRMPCNLSDEDRWLLKMADMLELMYYSLQEYNMGNKFSHEWFWNGYNYILRSLQIKHSQTARVRMALEQAEKAWAEMFDGEPSHA